MIVAVEIVLIVPFFLCSSAGDVKIYDIRKNDSIHTTQAVQNYGMSCISIHRSANTFAWYVTD